MRPRLFAALAALGSMLAAAPAQAQSKTLVEILRAATRSELPCALRQGDALSKLIVDTRALAAEELTVGIDVGGTKFVVAAVSPEGKIIAQQRFPTFDTNSGLLETPEDVHRLLDRMADGVEAVGTEATAKGAYRLAPRVGIGTPGKLVNGKISSDAPQMGPAWLWFDLEKELATKVAERLGEPVQVSARNDALAQMAFGLEILGKDPAYRVLLEGRRVAYVGPGTGLGGGFVEPLAFDEAGRPIVKFMDNDGHIADILIRDANGKLVEAESRLSGMHIQNELGIDGRELSDRLEAELAQGTDNPVYEPFVREMGRTLGKTIERIYLGSFEKNRETLQWTAEEIAAVAGIDRYIIGGSIGTKGAMGEIIRGEAAEYLESRGILGVEIIPITGESGDAGVLGAARFAE